MEKEESVTEEGKREKRRDEEQGEGGEMCASETYARERGRAVSHYVIIQ